MYAKIVNGAVAKFPYSMGDLHKENPNTSFPSLPNATALALFGVHRVVDTERPQVDGKTHSCVQSVQQVDGVWTRAWTPERLPESSAAANVRGHRDNLLKSSDWTQVTDAPVDKAAWAAYRQALRDITAQAGFPWTIDWPVTP